MFEQLPIGLRQEGSLSTALLLEVILGCQLHLVAFNLARIVADLVFPH